MHIPLRRDEVLMPGELLNGPRRRPAHREMGTERVTKSMDSVLIDLRTPGRPFDMMLHGVRRQSRTIRIAEHTR
jgi:hypothetical protein